MSRRIVKKRLNFLLDEEMYDIWSKYLKLSGRISMADLIREAVNSHIRSEYKPLVAKKAEVKTEEPNLISNKFLKIRKNYKCTICNTTGIKPQKLKYHECPAEVEY